MKKIFFSITLLLLVDFSQAQSGKMSDLFKQSQLPKPQTQGRAGSTVAQLSASCQRLTNSPLVALAQQVLPQYQIATSPVIPFVGFTIGLIQYDSPIMQTCNLLINIDKADTQGIIMQTGSYLNQLSANKFDEELNAVDRVLNASNSVYDFTNGTYRKGALGNASSHQQLVGVLDATTKVYNKRVQNKNQGLETKAQRRAQIDQVTASAYRRSIIQEATTCPSPQSNTNYGKMWTDYVPPRQIRIEEEKSNVDYLYDALTRMGSDMISEVSEIQEYMSLLNNIRFNGINYVATPVVYSENDTELTGQLDREGKPKKKNKTKNKKVNTFTVSLNAQTLNQFMSRYSNRWKKYIKGEMLSSGTFGLLSDKKGRIEAKYRNYAFECSERRLARTLGLSPSDPLYQTRLMQEQNLCRERLKVRQNEVESVFENYLNQMVNSLQLLYKNQAEIWNFEATKMGYNREVDKVDSAGSTGNYQTVQVSCSDKLEIHEIKKLKMENKKVNNELKEAWVKAKVENNMRQQEEDKQTSLAIKESAKANRSTIRQASEAEKPLTMPVSVKPTDRPLGL